MGFFPNCTKEVDGALDVAAMKVAIVGGSLGGLAAANTFHRLGASVSVFEKSPSSLEQRGGCLGFVDVGLWESIRGARMRRDGKLVSHSPVFDGQHSFDHGSQGSFYYGDMWQFLATGLPDGCIKFGATVETLGDAERPCIAGEEFDLVIVADGGWSTLREKYIPTTRQPEYTGYQIYWGRVDAAEVPDIRSFGGQTEWNGIYNAVLLPVPHFDGRRSFMSAFFVPTPENEIRQPERGDNRHLSQTKGPGLPPAWFVPFVRRLFGQHIDGEIVRFTEAAAETGKITPSPVFEFATSKTVAGRVVVIGDAAHMASPFTALGAHTALLDAKGLWDAFTSRAAGDIESALRAYDKGGTRRAQELLRRSRAVSRLMLPKQGKIAVQSPASLLDH